VLVSYILKTPGGSFSGLEVLIIFGTPFLVALASYLYHYLNSSKSSYYSFDKNTNVAEDSLMQAYIFLAMQIIHAERRDKIAKLNYIQGYFQRVFPNEAEDIHMHMRETFEQRHSLKRITSWMKINLNYSQRTQVMYFLFGIAIVDGKIIGSEVALLRPIAALLGITPKDFQSIYSSYNQREENKTQLKPKKRRKEIAAEILGVSINASKEEIKKVYRDLAKKYHPDKLSTQSVSQQKIAEERFKEIQLAYEILYED